MILDEVDFQIRNYVASLNEDAPLISERDIAKKFQLDRKNSRRLLKQMEIDGLLECIPQKGYRRIDYSRTTHRTFYTVRLTIEAEAARLAASFATREEILRMMLILEEAEEALNNKNIDEFNKLDSDFHNAMINASHDNMLKKLYSFIFVPRHIIGTDPVTHTHHMAIFNAIRAHDPEEAENAVRVHLTRHPSEKIIEE